jgi:hypothetical protein
MSLNRIGVQNSYNYKVKIGNWSEEQELEELKVKEYLAKKRQAGSSGLTVHSLHATVQAALKPVELTFTKDGALRIGDCVMLYSIATEGVLSIDPSDKLETGGYSVSTSQLTKTHVARNSFIIESFDRPNAKQGELLLYGENIRIRCHPEFLSIPSVSSSLYLHSQPLNAFSASKRSKGHQEVGFIPDNKSHYSTAWRVHHREINKRFEMNGKPILANHEVVLFHSQTQQALHSAKLAYLNDFGSEYQTICHTELSNMRNHGLLAERTGSRTAEIPFRPELKNNHWAFLTAAQTNGKNDYAGQEEKTQENQSVPSVSSSSPSLDDRAVLLDYIRHRLFGSGPLLIHELSKTVRLFSQETGISLDLLPEKTFLNALERLDVKLQEAQTTDLIDLYRGTAKNTVNFARFLSELRGDQVFQGARSKFVTTLFHFLQQLDSSAGPNSIPFQCLIDRYEPQQYFHSASEESFHLELIQPFEDYAIHHQGKLNKEDWIDFYATVSAFEPDENKFMQFLSKAYGVQV